MKKGVTKSLSNLSGSWCFRGGETIYWTCRSNDFSKTLYILTSEGFKHDISMVPQPMPFGGSRYWFLCPKCGQRQRKLYLKDQSFLCRACHRLTYVSQQKGKVLGKIEQVKRLYLKLGGDGRFPNAATIKRPKGMHHKTYYEISTRIKEMLSYIDDQMASDLRLLANKDSITPNKMPQQTRFTGA